MLNKPGFVGGMAKRRCMWTEKALTEASSDWGMVRVTIEAPDRDGDPSVTLRTWSCKDGTIVARGNASSGYTLNATCDHELHHEMGEYPSLEVSAIDVLDPAGAPVSALPSNAADYRLRFSLGSLALQFPPRIRVEIFPDSELALSQLEEIDAGSYSAPATFDVPLQGVARHDRLLSIHVLDPHTAKRDRNADGVKLWQARYLVK